jgi:hypothetical protein
MKPFLRAVLATSALFLLGACQGTGASSAATVNQKCPMSNEDVAAECTTSFDGQTVGFCCDTCLGKFQKLSTDEKRAKLTAAMPAK